VSKFSDSYFTSYHLPKLSSIFGLAQYDRDVLAGTSFLLISSHQQIFTKFLPQTLAFVKSLCHNSIVVTTGREEPARFPTKVSGWLWLPPQVK
jgi:hypothetical protein